MKYIILLLIAGFTASNTLAQTNLLAHYKAYYSQMKKQGDVQGIINGLTHLSVLEPSEARTDTLGYIYMNEGMHVQALNTVGVEKQATDSDIRVEIKAVSLKALNQPERALVHFQEIFNRENNPYLAYEMAELNLQLQNYDEANKNIEYGLANSTDDMKKAFYESQVPYQVNLASGFKYLKAITFFNQDRKANIQQALQQLEALAVEAPNFRLLALSIQALKSEMQNATTNEN